MGRLGRLTRELLNDPSESRLEKLAAECSAYLAAHICVCLAHLRFGFDEPFAQIAQSVADWELATLFRRDDAAPDRYPYPGLLQALSGGWRGRGSRPEDPQADRRGALAELHDRDLGLALREALRQRARQGCSREWKRRHPEQSRMLRALKHRIRASGGLTLSADGRGQFLLGAASSFAMQPMPLAEVSANLGGIDPSDFHAVVERLATVLVPTREHGGYCFVMDVVHCLWRHMVSSVARDAEAAAAEAGLLLSRGGLPLDLWRKRLRALWTERAHSIAEHLYPDLEPATRLAYVDAAVDAAEEAFGVNGPAGHHTSLEQLVRRRLDVPADIAEWRRHLHRADYVLRLLRREVRERRLHP